MAKTGRNYMSTCGSGKKFKRGHGAKGESGRRSTFLTVVVGGAILAAIAVGTSQHPSAAGELPSSVLRLGPGSRALPQ
jgi:hypothetical protein